MEKKEDIVIIKRLLENAGEFEVRAVRIFCEKILNLEVLNLEEGGESEDDR